MYNSVVAPLKFLETESEEVAIFQLFIKGILFESQQ